MEGLVQDWGQTVVGDGDGALDTRFSFTEGFGDGSTSTCFLVSLLESNPLSPRMSQLTSA